MVSAHADPLAEVSQALERGEVVGVPTDTVYGLAVRAGDAAAVARLFAMKGRPDAVALPVLVSDLAMAVSLTAQRAELEAVARVLWPGPLTVVLRRADSIAYALGGDDDTIGLRCPDHDLLRALIERVGPLAVSSANRHGEPAATTPSELRRDLNSSVVVLDGGRCYAEPSSVISMLTAPYTCLREGPVSLAAVVAASGPFDGGAPARERA